MAPRDDGLGAGSGGSEAARSAHLQSRHYESSLDTYNVKLHGRRTTLRLEPDLWDALQEISRDLGCRVDDLASEVELARGGGSLTSSLRSFIVRHYREKSREIPAGTPGCDWAAPEVLRAGDRSVMHRIEQMYRYWEEHPARSGRLPLLEDVDPAAVAACGLAGYLHVADASADDPMNYRIRVWGGKVVFDRGRTLAGMRLAHLPGRPYRETTVREYRAAVASRQPTIHRVVASVEGRPYDYQRLLLPAASRRGSGPDRLLVVIGSSRNP
jgi:predicted DNA-binding ribbon-helix-helix protein